MARVTFSMSQNDCQALRDFAKNNNMTMSSVVVQALQEHYAQVDATKFLAQNREIMTEYILAIAEELKKNHM